MDNQYYKAFTIFEIVLILGIMMLLALIVIPVSVKQLRGAQAKALADEMHSNLFTQQQFAYTGKNGKSYSIAFFNDHYSIFTGQSLATSEDIFDIEYPGETYSEIFFSNGGNEIVFNIGSIKPSTSGYINITTETESYQVNINSQGLAQVQKL